MRNLLLVGVGALLLTACAPNQSAQYRVGRIVNVTTGAEGRVLLGGWGSVTGRNTASVELGDVTYQGEYNVLSAGQPVRLDPVFGVTFGSGAGGTETGFRGGLYLRPSNLRQGNLVVRAASGAVITCDLTVDEASRGVGGCTDGQGQRYSVQF
ncbi:hypothetical protein [Deinococcus pimensis]|uniref:hypothetical protein n=1 Tax=Deinococcus pimensis TaxID=309888 RepID=UPI000480F70A|nr:hypothetical protein [Deinococcus pimensis]